MQNYTVHAYVISMEFSAVNRRRPSRETPIIGPGAKKDGLFSQAKVGEKLFNPTLMNKLIRIE